MNDDRETRWLDSSDEAGPPEALRALLRAELEAQDDGDARDGGQLARMLAGVASEVGRPELLPAWDALARGGPGDAGAGSVRDAGAHPSTAPSATLGGGGAAWKLTLGLLLVGGLGMLALDWGKGGGERAPAQPPQPAAPEAAAPRVADTHAPAAEPIDATEAHAVDATEVEAETQAELEAAELEAETDADDAQPAPRKVRRAGRPGQTLAARGLEGADPVQELALLEQAQRALRDDPAAALSLSGQHAELFRHGQFVQEREMIAIEALLGLDQRERADARGRRFLRRFPRSSHVPRLKQLLAAPPP